LRDRLIILAPALIPAAYVLAGMVLYLVLCSVGRRPPRTFDRERGNFFDFFIHYFIWLLGPIERGLLAARLTPNTLTLGALLACAGAGFAIATGHMATAGWLYVAAGGLDILDGRLARATGKQSEAGAFLDSVTDRWGELLVFSGFAWFLRDSYWLLAVMLAIAGSMMVSYTRARGESLGIDLAGGLMQRSERVTLVSIGTLITAWFDAGRDTQAYGAHVIGTVLLLTGLGSAGTAIARWVRGVRLLREREADQAEKRAKAQARATRRRAARPARASLPGSPAAR
jgi:phosphatidylglycerophosphate synthase